MRVVFAFPLLLLLAAAANAQFFRIVPKQGTTVFKVRGIVTLTTPELSGHSSSALEYLGELAVRRLTHDNYAAQFLKFDLLKYNRTLNTVDTPVFEGVPEVEDYKEHFDQPINFVFKHGKVLVYYVPYYSKMWTVNIYRAVLTLFQSAPVDPRVIVDAPKVFSVYEDAVNGYCRVQYEVKVESNKDLEINKVQLLDDCQEERPIYALDDADVQGCPGVCSEHYPENFLPGYKEETVLNAAKPGCPVSQRPTDVLVNVHSYSYYNVSNTYLQNVTTETVDVLRQYGGKVTAHTKLTLEVLHRNGPEIVKYKHNTNYDSLKFRMPRVYNDLDVPIYSLLLSDIKAISPATFKQFFDVAVEELLHLNKVDKTGDAKKTPSLLLQLIEALTAFTEEQLLATVPTPLKKTLKECTQDEQLVRGLYLDLLSKAGSKSAVKVLLQLVASGKLSHFEAVHAVQDVAAFKAYPDKDYVELLVDVCVQKKGKLSPLVHAATCAALGKVISKACPSKIDLPPYVPKPPEDIDGPFVRPNKTEPEIEPEVVPSAAEAAAHLPPFDYKDFENCTVVHLEKHIQTLTLALKATKDFKEAVAYVTALAKAAKPEVLPALLGYLNGTAPNLKYFVDEAETVEEAVIFFRQLTLLALEDFVKFYPKELNPVVRALYLNTTEDTQLRTMAFDLWLKTVPEKWEVQKVLITAKLDDSLELGSYVYTALKSLLHSKLPCEQILASRVRSVFRHVKHLDLGFRFSHLYKRSMYNFKRELGIEATLKKIASNSSRIAASHLSLLYNLGPFYRQPVLYSILPKGGEQLVAELLGEGGLLTLISKVLGGHPRPAPHSHLKDPIAEELKIVDRNSESPKAAFFWKFLNGETVVPVDKKYLQELKLELVEWVRQLVSGNGNKHFVRVLLPAKQYHVEPSTLGIPLVHSIIHPVVISLRVDNLKVTYENIIGSVAPAKIMVTGTFLPAVLSLRQTRVFAADVEKFHSPSVVVSDVKEVLLQSHVVLSYYNATRRLFLEVKPTLNRVLLSTHCVEHTLKWNHLLTGSPSEPWLDYSKCYKSLPFPHKIKADLFGKELGMVVKVNGTCDKPGGGHPVFGSPKAKAEGYLQAVFQNLVNLGWKHYQYTVGLESYTQSPVDRWRLHLHCTSNLDELDVGPKPQPPCPWCEVDPLPVAAEPELLRSIRMSEVKDVSPQLVQFMEETEEAAAAALYPEFTGLNEMFDGLQVLLNKTQKPLYKTGYQHNATVILVGCYEVQLRRLLKLALTETHSLDRTARKFALHLTTDFLQTELKVYGNVTYPEVDSYFNLEPAYIGTDFINASVVVSLKPKSSEEETYVFYYNATKSEEQLVGFSNYHYKPLLKWFTPQCLADLKAGKTVSYACHKAIVHDGHLDKQVLLVRLPQKVSPVVKQVAHTVVDLVKYYLYPRVVFHAADPVLPYKNELLFYFNKTAANPFVTLLNAEAYLPHEKLVVKNLPVPKYFSPNTALTIEERVVRTLTKDHPLQPCGIGKHAIRTFDNLTFPLEVRQNCKYLITRDCYGVSNFSVSVEPIDIRSGLKKLYVRLYDTVVEILPPALYSPEVKLFVNKTAYVALADRDVVLKYSDVHHLLVQVHRSPNPREGPIVLLKTTNNILKLNFDGYNVYVWVNKKYQRQTCGVCGNYDNEASQEFVMPNTSIALNYTHFVTSYAYGAELCKVPVYPVPSVHSELLYDAVLTDAAPIVQDLGMNRHQTLRSMESVYDDEVVRYTPPQARSWMPEARVPDVEELDECSLYRTVKRAATGKLCFSKTPVYACKPGCVKSKGKTVEVSFACVPKRSEVAAEWVNLLAENDGVLPEKAFEGKDYELQDQSVLVPEKCLPAQ